MKWGNLFSALIFASIGALGCVAADEPGNEDVDSVSQALDCADCVAVRSSVLFTDFDRFTHELTGILGDGLTPVTILVTPETVMGVPPDPVLPVGICGINADKWVRVVTRPDWDEQKKHNHVVIELLPKLARDGCTADVVWLAGGGPLTAAEIVFP